MIKYRTSQKANENAKWNGEIPSTPRVQVDSKVQSWDNLTPQEAYNLGFRQGINVGKRSVIELLVP